MKEYKNNLIGKEFGVFDLDMRKHYPKAKGWLPIETYDLIQCGYPLPDHGEMILRPDGGTNKKSELLPPKGIWCKAEDVKKLLSNGKSIETDTLPDVDALLMEESKKLHILFAQYNRQLLLIGEMKGSDTRTASNGCVFFHIGTPVIKDTPEELGKAWNTFYGRTDKFIRLMSNGNLGIGNIPHPQVEPDLSSES